jgi:hypothetical protein
MERAAASGYDAALSDSDAPMVATICCRLDGIVLAIELAASRAGPPVPFASQAFEHFASARACTPCPRQADEQQGFNPDY